MDWPRADTPYSDCAEMGAGHYGQRELANIGEQGATERTTRVEVIGCKRAPLRFWKRLRELS